MATENIQPDAELRELDRLVGTWKVSGEAEGTITYSWLDGGFFLKQEVELVQAGERHTGVEVIGREKPMFAEQASEDIKSRFYGDQGETLDYVYEPDGDTRSPSGVARRVLPPTSRGRSAPMATHSTEDGFGRAADTRPQRPE